MPASAPLPRLPHLTRNLITDPFPSLQFSTDSLSVLLLDSFSILPSSHLLLHLVSPTNMLSVQQAPPQLSSYTRSPTSNPFVVLALDFSNAFDTVRHATLLRKFALLDIADAAYNWLVEYTSISQDAVSARDTAAPPQLC